MSNIDQKPPGRPRSIQSHQAILLAEVGFDGMSIEAIAARARVGKTTVYRRYASKED
jgi:AcrR family transcriptional regulator